MVETAIAALKAFGATNREQAAALLKIWAHRDQLEAWEVREVLQGFPR
jgi:hypothetical protein